MDLNIKGFDTNQHTVEVGEDDTVEGLRRKVASAMGLLEDGFCMSFGDEALGEGADMTQLSAGDTIILTKTQKEGERQRAATWYPRGAAPSALGGVACESASRAVAREQFWCDVWRSSRGGRERGRGEGGTGGIPQAV